MKALEHILRLVLGGVFLYAGAAKVVDVETFFWDVHHFELTSWDVSLVLAVFLPWLELLAGGALVVRWLYLGGVALCGGMSAVFLAAIASAWWRGLDITCGCFGREENATNFAQHIALNAGMLAASVVLACLARRK